MTATLSASLTGFGSTRLNSARVIFTLNHVEIPALIAFALAFFPMIRGDAVVSRREGLVLVLAFAGWVAWLLYPRF